MNFFTALVISAILATVIYCVIWRFVIALFRVRVTNLLYYGVWCRIEKEVGKFVLTIIDEKLEGDIITLDSNGENISLDIDDVEIMKILRNTILFNCVEVNNTLYECSPNEHFSQVVKEALIPSMKKTSNKLHNQFEGFPKLVQAYLYGANNVLARIDAYIED